MYDDFIMEQQIRYIDEKNKDFKKLYRKKKLNDILRKYRWIIIGLIIIIIPIIINGICTNGFFGLRFLKTAMNESSWLTFYSGYLSFLGTFFLGYIAYLQTKKMNEQNQRLLNIEEERDMPYVKLFNKRFDLIEDDKGKFFLFNLINIGKDIRILTINTIIGYEPIRDIISSLHSTYPSSKFYSIMDTYQTGEYRLFQKNNFKGKMLFETNEHIEYKFYVNKELDNDIIIIPLGLSITTFNKSYFERMCICLRRDQSKYYYFDSLIDIKVSS